MGFSGIQRARYPVNLITSSYYYSGKVEPKGPFSIWMNEADYATIALFEANGATFDAGSSIDSVARDELLLLKTDIVAIDLLSAEARKTVPLMQRVQKVVFYTTRYVFNASFPASAEARMDQLLDQLKGGFFPVLSVETFPLRPTRLPVFRTSEMVLLNRAHITHFHTL